MKKKDSFFVPLIISLSIIIPIAVALLMIFPDVLYIESETINFSSLPFFHAILNGCTAVLLVTGFVWIKNKKTKAHKVSMMTAFILSSIFLIS
jgi:putative membrane protein